MRLIDADKLKADLRLIYREKGYCDYELHFSLVDMENNIDTQESIKHTVIVHEGKEEK